MVYVVRMREFFLEFGEKSAHLNEAKILCRSMSVAEAMDFLPHLRVPKGLFLDEEADAQRTALFEEVCKRIISWELVDENQNILPITTESMRSLLPEDSTAICQAYADEIAGVNRNLEQPSNDGDTFPEESIPMETE